MDRKLKVKENEKRNKYLDLARTLKREIWNMKMTTMIPNEIGALETMSKGLVKGLEDLEIKGQVESFQTTALLKLARILRKVLETWRDLLGIKLQC